MIQSYVRSAMVCCGVIGTVLSTPSESQAIFHWFGNCCQPRTTYAPIQPAVNCNPCASQVAQYVPTTCYRQECVSVPVTVMQPVTSCSMSQCNPCNPCSWCPTQTTTLRPVTVMQQQVRMVPYTTYRIVYTQPSPCATGCNTGCATAMPATSTYYQPSAPAPMMPSTGSCCGGGGAAPASYSQPMTTYPAPATQQPTYGTPAPTLSTPPMTAPAPATSAPATSAPQSTYESGRPTAPTTTEPSTAPLSPIPQSSSSTIGPSFGPSLAPPASSRTTSTPVQRAWMVRPVSTPASAPAWLQTQRATPTTSANNTNSVSDDWRPSVR